MRFLTTVIIAALGATSAQAQVVHTRPAAPAAGAVAGIAPAPAVVVIPGTSVPVPTQPFVFFGSVPVVVLPDGRVFADFGRGYEHIVRTCGVPVTFVSSAPFSAQPTVVQPTVVQPGAAPLQPLPYTPPVPNQAGSQPMFTQPGQVVTSQTCWSTNARGQVYVSRF